MAIVSFGTFSKRRNSTKQPATLSDQRTVTLKENCSQDHPVFICSGNNFNYNYCMWDSKYYFIEDTVSLANNEIEIRCVMDPLATYKSEILASTQFVSYSSQSGGTWLADNRIPVQKNATVAKNTTTMNFLFNDTGFYVLAAVGENGCQTYGLDRSEVDALIQNVNTWIAQDKNTAETPISQPIGQAYSWPASGNDYADLSSVITDSMASMVSKLCDCFAHMQYSVVQSDVLGNAYVSAPSCVRSCIWVPFFATFFTTGAGGATIHLGAYDTGVTARTCKTTPESRTVTVNIPWQYSDWRRTVCEEVYLYLPMVGLVNIPSDEIVNESQIEVTWSATATDGCIAYLVKAGNQVIGTFGANCAVNYPIGFSQQASAGEIYQSYLAGAEKMISTGVQAASGINPAGWIAGAAGATMEGINTAYDVANTALSRHNSCIGGIGGGAGVGLDLDLTCYTVAHPTVISPADMKVTMGLPTMKPIALSTLTGFCQCANAHVEAPATAGELDAIDFYLNSGFYIE